MTDTSETRIELDRPPKKAILVFEQPLPPEVRDEFAARLQIAIAADKWPLIIHGVGRAYWLEPPEADA